MKRISTNLNFLENLHGEINSLNLSKKLGALNKTIAGLIMQLNKSSYTAKIYALVPVKFYILPKPRNYIILKREKIILPSW